MIDWGPCVECGATEPFGPNGHKPNCSIAYPYGSPDDGLIHGGGRPPGIQTSVPALRAALHVTDTPTLDEPYMFVSSCDWGDCDEPTIAIRHDDGVWLSACRLHVADAEAADVAPIVTFSPA